MKKSRYGHWVYKVYDAKTNELLAKGTSREVAKKMMWGDYYALRMADLYLENPNRKPRYEYVLREWVQSIYEVKDYKLNQTFMGNYDECKNEIMERIGHQLKEDTIKKYFNNNTKRFEIRRIKDV